jgi:glutamate 5-kinase
MKCYKDLFKRFGIRVAQVLLTHHNFSTQSEERTIREIMEAYLEQRTIPIVNENDMVNKEEVEAQPIFSDNDILAALVAVRLRADRLLILTDVDGLYQANPKHNSDVALVEEVRQIDRSIEQMAAKETNPLGLGGMASKVRAARLAAEQGIETIVGNGRYRLTDILAHRVPCTRFRAADKG